MLNVKEKNLPDDKLIKNFEKRLTDCMSKNNCSGDKLARDTGFSKATISGYKNGKYEAKICALAAIARYFGVSTDYMLGLTDVKTVKPDLKSSCEYTHLSDSAVEQLHTADLKKHPLYRDIASYLIEQEIFEKIVLLLEHSLITGQQYKILYGSIIDNDGYNENDHKNLLDTQEFKFNQQLSSLYKDVMKDLSVKLADQIKAVTNQRWEELQDAAQETIEKMEAILAELAPLDAEYIRQRINDEIQ